MYLTELSVFKEYPDLLVLHFLKSSLLIFSFPQSLFTHLVTKLLFSSFPHVLDPYTVFQTMQFFPVALYVPVTVCAGVCIIAKPL